MRQLRGEDARFVYAESGHANSNITLVSIYDPSTAPGGRVRYLEFLRHVESRLHLSPIFRQKLLRVPLELDHPYWIEDERFDLEYHVRHIALPKPGDWRQFCIQASRTHARSLDMTKPLWELYLVEGLDAFLDLPKDSFAVLAKIHHAAIDVVENHTKTLEMRSLRRSAPSASGPLAARPCPRSWGSQEVDGYRRLSGCTHDGRVAGGSYRGERGLRDEPSVRRDFAERLRSRCRSPSLHLCGGACTPL